MRLLTRIALLVLFVFSVNSVFAEDTACCEQLRKEIQILKDQQDQLFKNLKQDEVTEKKSFSTLEGLLNLLASKFPDMKDTLKKIKDMYAHR